MARIVTIKEQHPTLATVAVAMNDAKPDGVLAGVTAADIATATKRRGHRVRDGRVSVDALPDVFLELRIMKAAA